MDSIISVLIFDVVILLFIFLKKNNDSLIYTISPEEEYAENLKAFDENLIAIDNMDVSDYKLGSGHIYN